jgi:ferredoxin
MFYYSGQAEPFKCVACGKCVGECPAGALEITEVRDLEEVGNG